MYVYIGLEVGVAGFQDYFHLTQHNYTHTPPWCDLIYICTLLYRLTYYDHESLADSMVVEVPQPLAPQSKPPCIHHDQNSVQVVRTIQLTYRTTLWCNYIHQCLLIELLHARALINYL